MAYVSDLVDFIHPDILGRWSLGAHSAFCPPAPEQILSLHKYSRRYWFRRRSHIYMERCFSGRRRKYVDAAIIRYPKQLPTAGICKNNLSFHIQRSLSLFFLGFCFSACNTARRSFAIRAHAPA
jgi:hypothetical protein